MNKTKYEKDKFYTLITIYLCILQIASLEVSPELCAFSFRDTQSLGVEINLTLIILECFGFLGQILQISARFSSGNVIFTWTPSYYSMYNVLLTRDTSSNDSALVNNTQYTVRDVLLYDSITISVKSIGSPVDNRMTYNGTFLHLSYLILRFIQ